MLPPMLSEKLVGFTWILVFLGACSATEGTTRDRGNFSLEKTTIACPHTVTSSSSIRYCEGRNESSGFSLIFDSSAAQPEAQSLSDILGIYSAQGFHDPEGEFLLLCGMGTFTQKQPHLLNPYTDVAALLITKVLPGRDSRSPATPETRILYMAPISEDSQGLHLGDVCGTGIILSAPIYGIDAEATRRVLAAWPELNLPASLRPSANR